MESIRRRYRLLIIITLLVFALAISVVFSLAIRDIARSYRERASASMIAIKKDYLKDTVNNTIRSIEDKLMVQTASFTRAVEEIRRHLAVHSQPEDLTFIGYSREVLQAHPEVSAVIRDKISRNIVYQSERGAGAREWSEADLLAMQKEEPVFSRFTTGRYDVNLFVRQAVIDQHVKDQMRDEIHRYVFSNDAYLWVNEIVRYEGGKDYAIRRIHPNLKETEGMLLSTDMTDVAGNLPYLTELEGVKRDGELFFTYFFKKKDSDIVSEKVTYAKLYRPYNWIIAMGVHLDDVEAYADQANVASASSVRHLVLVIAAVTACLMAVALVLLSLLERWYFRKTNLAFREKADLDHLTAAYNRRAAEELLKSLFSQFKITGQNSVILMFDIDDFKKINDMYGHDQGDAVLRQLSDALSHQIRSSDHLCRWGGDEFLLVCPSMPESDTAAFAAKLLNQVSGLEIPTLNKMGSIKITISIGLVRFIRTDLGFMDAIKRADRAMYRSKEAGKNRATVA